MTSKSIGPARSGRRNPSLLEPGNPPNSPGLGQVYLAAKPVRVGDHLLPIGTEVPGASEWPRIEAWVNARTVRAARPDEEYLTYEEFLASVTTEPETEEPEPETPEIIPIEEPEPPRE